jgi:hypothetical protein
MSKHYADWTLAVDRVSLSCVDGEITPLSPIVSCHETSAILHCIGHDLTLEHAALAKDLLYRGVNPLALTRWDAANLSPDAVL